jgi:hypothetical protein
MKPAKIIQSLFHFSDKIRYVAIYSNNQLLQKQREQIENASSGESDRYEELLVNPTLLKLVTQRANIDCGSLDYLVIKYGNFYQFIKSTASGHISVCLDKSSMPVEEATKIIEHLQKEFRGLFD